MSVNGFPSLYRQFSFLFSIYMPSARQAHLVSMTMEWMEVLFSRSLLLGNLFYFVDVMLNVDGICRRNREFLRNSEMLRKLCILEL